MVECFRQRPATHTHEGQTGQREPTTLRASWDYESPESSESTAAPCCAHVTGDRGRIQPQPMARHETRAPTALTLAVTDQV